MNLKETIGTLPSDAVLVLEDISWEEYEQLLDDLGETRGARVTYDRGRLQIVTASFKHEGFKEFGAALARILSEELKIDLESFGSTTYKRKKDQKGTEPDTCFYVVNVERVIGLDRVPDLNIDPVPDVVWEFDFTSSSSAKLSIYARFGIPEIWRYVRKQRRFFILELRDQVYVEALASRFFPILTADTLTRFIHECEKVGQSKALASFRRWIRQQRRKRQ